MPAGYHQKTRKGFRKMLVKDINIFLKKENQKAFFRQATEILC